MDIGVRVMTQVQVTTSITLVRFLSQSLHDYLNPLDTVIFSVLVLCVTYIVGHEYVLSPLSRRLAILLMLEKIKPIFTHHIDNGELFRVHGLMINAGYLSLVAVVPPSLKATPEVSLLIQAIMYLYSDALDIVVQDKAMHLTALGLGFASLAYLSKMGPQQSSMFTTVIEVGSIAVTYLVLSVLQSHVDSLPETSLLQLSLIITAMHFASIPGLESVEDYIIYNFAVNLQSYITSDPWYWCGMLFVLLQLLVSWLTIKSMATRILLLLVINLAVANTLAYIRRLAVYDTVITLKTSTLVLQFVLQELSRKITK